MGLPSVKIPERIIDQPRLAERPILAAENKKLRQWAEFLCRENRANSSAQTGFETPLRHFLYQPAKDSQFENVSL